MNKFSACFLFLLFFTSSLFAQDMRIDKDKNIINTRDEVIPGYFIFDFGASSLLNAPDPMDLKVWGSWSVNLSYLGNIDLGTNVKFLPGVSLAVDNYMFKDDVSLFRGKNVLGEDKVQFYELEQDEIRKSKFSVTYIDIPLEFHYIPNPTKKGLRFALGGKFGIPVSGATKIRYKDDGANFIDKTKNNFHVSKVRYGALARIGYGSFYLFGYYGFNSLFQKDKLDCDCNGGSPITIGITLFAF
ncbi:outer membrane beta-barrel protein [Bernardetia sp. ABR2-2B]|uniref:outer membrane beta-barrel protein n=1 Tax=Bernardetia sp. ABR2-2B TaxID=3127472 RepID=UPI0030CF33D4